MKLNRKWLLAIALVLSLTMAISGTLAYLTDRDTVENVFTMGNVDIEVEENFNQNSPLYPGVAVDKEAGITNTHATEPAYVWMVVSVPDALAQYIELGWAGTYSATEVTSPHAGYTGYLVKYPDALAAGKSTGNILESVKLTANVDYQNGKYVAFSDGKPTVISDRDLSNVKIMVDGFAIQTKGFNDVNVAYDAYYSQWGNSLKGGESGVPTGTAVATADELVAALANGGDVYLTADIVLTDAANVPSGVTTTLNLNGHTISQTKECTESYSMIANNGTLTITGNGKLSLTDTGANSGSGWGSYTIRNSGTLVVKNGTIEHIGANAQNNVNNAIFHYSGTVTIDDGIISAPYSRSLRVWSGTATINGGSFDGQVWVQAMSDDCSLTINGGSFKPATYGNDGSSVFVTNDTKNPSLSVTGGSFATKIGCSDASKLAGVITGGTFTDEARAQTNSSLFAS